MKQVFRGPQGSEFHYLMRFYCAENYFGPNCTCHETAGSVCNRTTGEIKCKENYYGPKCRVYCKDAVSHVCNKDGSKNCTENFVGPDCQCKEVGNFVCDEETGARRCKKDYYREDCAIYCKATDDYMCSHIDGSKLYGGIIVDMHLIEFNNPNKVDADNGTCDPLSIGKFRDCDPMFEGCISDKPVIDNMKDDCSIGHFSTQVYSNTNDVNFTSILGPSLRNPVLMGTNSSWKV